MYYPIFLDIRGKRVLVAGAGKVALRKVRGLLEAGAEATVIAPECDPAFESLPVLVLRRRFRPSDLRGAVLAFAATNDRKVNAALGRAARRLGIPANIADAREECGFIVPARITHGDLQIAISTGGTSPRRASEVRKKLEAFLRS